MKNKITPAKLIGAFSQMVRDPDTKTDDRAVYREVLCLPTASLQTLADALNEVWSQP